VTVQFTESLRYQDESLDMQAMPLRPYLDSRPDLKLFQDMSTACWRRYIGTWAIVQKRLYLIAIQARWEADASPVSLEQLFPGFPDQVFAHWYTGVLRCAQGERLNYAHMGFGSMSEQDLLLYVDEGVVIKTEFRHNALPGEKDNVHD
jgi:hypothetical protein